MRALLPLTVLAVAALVGACANDVAGPAGAAPADRGAPPASIDAPADDSGDPSGDDSGDAAHDTPVAPDDAPPPVDDPDAPPPADEDPDGDGAVLTDEPPGPPADAHQACVEWTDCGPLFANPNSGFDCVDSTCACDATGQWATACAGISGVWSPQDCFCYVGTSQQPTTQAVPPQDAVNREDDVVCWYRWKDLGCDPDRWVDTSYYDHQCDSHGCWDEYVNDGYYVDGECYGRWVTRCSNGYEYW